MPAFIAGFTSGSFAGVPGITDTIVAAGAGAYKIANSQSYQTVFLTTLAFTGLAIGLSFFSPNVDDKMTNDVAAALHVSGVQTANEESEKRVMEV